MLRNYFLVALSVENDVFEVQFATRKWLEKQQELEQWKETYIAIMADAFPPGMDEHWGRCQMLFPHAELVLEYRPVDEGFSDSGQRSLITLLGIRKSRASTKKPSRRIDKHGMGKRRC